MFENIKECIKYSQSAVSHFLNIAEIISEKDYKKWTNKLKENSGFKKYLLSAKFNLLNTTVIAGSGFEESIENHLLIELIKRVKYILEKTDLFLKTFSELKKNRSFLNKFKNLGNLNFLSTLSELTLAYEFKKAGFKVEFENKFRQIRTGKKKDVDISVIDENGNKFHIEVYMPNKQLDINVPFSFNQDDGYFKVDDNCFKTRVKVKLFNKFGLGGIQGLNGTEFNGKVLLAINKVFFDVLHIRSLLPFFCNDSIYADLLKLLPEDVDGLLIFEDEFNSEKSFVLEKIIYKNK